MTPHRRRGGAAGGPGWRARVRRTRGGALTLKVVVFVAGLLLVALGLAAAVLPGPLTIPPVLLGLTLWASEFPWAQRLLDRAREQAAQAWAAARRHPVTSGLTTALGLTAAGVAVWAAGRFELLRRAHEAVGL